MPVMRRYHMIWTYPAVALLGAAVHHTRLRARWSQLALGCIALVVVAQFTLLFKSLEARGTLLAAVPVLALPVVLMLARLARAPAAIPPPPGASPGDAGHERRHG
jgi:hypothetical protein